MFVGTAWLPEGKTEFMQNILPEGGEQVLFHESVVLGEGDTVLEPITVPKLEGVCFLTDGYGPSAAALQVDAAFGYAAQPGTAGLSAGSGSEAESVNLPNPVTG
mgnify:CR=1 FL=1